MTDRDDFAPPRLPGSGRPLLGLTLLAVEDSLYASEALRLMCLRSGARLRRADSLRSARRHLAVYRPSGVLVDVGLPDGSGTDLIAEMNRARPRVGVILAMTGDPVAGRAGLAAGADGLLLKPLESLGAFQQALLRHLPPERRPRGPYGVSDETIHPDPLAYRDDLEHVQGLMEDGTGPADLAYVAQFLSGVAHAAGDRALAEAAAGLAGHGAEAGIARVTGLITARLAARAAI